MVASNLAKYSDGSYSASRIEYAIHEGDTYSKIMLELKNDLIRHIGEVICFTSTGEMKILKNIQSEKFQKV